MDTPTRREATTVAAGSQDRPASARPAATAVRRAAREIGLAAAAVAYRDLLWYAPKRSLSEEIEQLFFVPSQGVAPLIMLLSGWLFNSCFKFFLACSA